MSICGIGDQVLCKVKDGEIISHISTVYDSLEKFEIVSARADGFLAFSYIFLKKEYLYRITKSNYKNFNVAKKFIDNILIYIPDFNIYKVSFNADGKCCSKCEEFFPLAEPNQSDGSFKCFLCRTYIYR